MQAFFEDFSHMMQEERAKTITQFTSYFTPSDWWHIKSLLECTADFHHFDIIPALPVELAISVLKYVPLVNIIKMRAVARRWNELLTSEDVCRGLVLEHHALDSWNRARSMASLTEKDRTIYQDSWRLLLDDVVSRRHFFAKGLHNRRLYHESDSHFQKLSLDEAAAVTGVYVEPVYHSGRLAILLQERIEVYDTTMDLNDDPIFSRWVPNREHVYKLGLSKFLVVVGTLMSNCQAWDLETGKRHSIRLEASNYEQLLCHARSVIIIYSDRVIRWEVDTNTYHCFARGDELVRHLQSPNIEACSAVDPDYTNYYVFSFQKTTPPDDNDSFLMCLWKIPISLQTAEQIQDTPFKIWHWRGQLDENCSDLFPSCECDHRRGIVSHAHHKAISGTFRTETGSVIVLYSFRMDCLYCYHRGFGSRIIIALEYDFRTETVTANPLYYSNDANSRLGIYGRWRGYTLYTILTPNRGNDPSISGLPWKGGRIYMQVEGMGEKSCFEWNIKEDIDAAHLLSTEAKILEINDRFIIVNHKFSGIRVLRFSGIHERKQRIRAEN